MEEEGTRGEAERERELAEAKSELERGSGKDSRGLDVNVTRTEWSGKREQRKIEKAKLGKVERQ